MDVPMELAQILISETVDHQMIVLKEKGGHRRFPIRIGISEAVAIDRRLKGINFVRPMTHDLLADVIEQLDGHLEKIVINDLRDITVDGQPHGTFFARLFISQNGRTVEIDSRPSDAIALGVANNTPIFVTDWVLNVVAGE
jgi:uncharacterized protein